MENFQPIEREQSIYERRRNYRVRIINGLIEIPHYMIKKELGTVVIHHNPTTHQLLVKPNPEGNVTFRPTTSKNMVAGFTQELRKLGIETRKGSYPGHWNDELGGLVIDLKEK